MRFAAIGLAACVLGGCTSAPQNRYYTLSSDASSAEAPAIKPESLPSIVVDVHLPGTINRPQIVERTGFETVAVHEFDRWAEPLDQLVSRVLGDDLSADVMSSGKPDGPHLGRLSVNIDTFIADTAGMVYLQGTFHRQVAGQLPGSRPTWRFNLSAQADPKQIADVAAAMSMLLSRLAKQIAQTR